MLAEAQRLSMLRAMGIEVYRLRAVGAEEAAAVTAGAGANIAVICAAAALAMPLRAQLPRVLGIAAQRVRWCDFSGSGLPEDAAAYVAIGTEAARALGAQLSTMQQNRSIIATTAEPSDLLRDGAAKRALWQVLKPVARRLRSVG